MNKRDTYRKGHFFVWLPSASHFFFDLLVQVPLAPHVLWPEHTNKGVNIPGFPSIHLDVVSMDRLHVFGRADSKELGYGIISSREAITRDLLYTRLG